MNTAIPARGRRTTSALLVLTALAAGCNGDNGQPAPADPGAHLSPVRVATVERVRDEQSLRLPGMLRAKRRAQPAFLQPGYLAERLVARGDQVAAGQPLAILANPALAPTLDAARARVRELEERLVQLEADYERAVELHQRGLVSTDQLDRALAARNATRAAREQAVAAAAEAREQVAEATLRAPFDAVIGDLLAEPGDFVMAGQPVLVLSGTGALEVEISLPEGLSGRLSAGLPVEVRSLASGQVLPGEVREFGVARAGRLAPAIIELAGLEVAAAGWKPGLSVQVTIAQGPVEALAVPLAAVVDPGTGRTRVYTVVDGRAQQTPVEVGRPLGNRVEVRGALAAGDQVVVAGHHHLLDGDRLRVLP